MMSFRINERVAIYSCFGGGEAMGWGNEAGVVGAGLPSATGELWSSSAHAENPLTDATPPFHGCGD